MPSHDIIDNRNEKLLDHINKMLDSSERARFAVGYFFVSGFAGIAERLRNLGELRLLIGNTTNHETLEHLAEGHRRLDLVEDALQEQQYPGRAREREMAAQTAANVRSAMELMDQTDEGEAVIHALVRLIAEKRIQIRVYTKGRLHAKAYIFDYGTVYDAHGNPVDRHEDGIAVVGSSNLSLSGIHHNTELNVVVSGNDNHAELVRWFDELWKEAVDFDEALMEEMRRSWAVAPTRPYDVYMKTLYALLGDRLGEPTGGDALWDDEIRSRLANFQEVAVRQAIQMIRDYGGAFVADVVGLGKSFVGAAIVKHFERTERARPLILCPAPLVEMWEGYNETYQLNARVLSMGYLREQDDGSNILQDPRYRDRDFVLVDESHNLRHSDTQRYRVVQSFLASGRRCCFLTATPRNSSAWDVYHQIKLFHPDDRTDLPIDPPDLREYFRMVDDGSRTLPDLLHHIQIRRLRNHVLRWYGYDEQTGHPVDPTRFSEYLEGKRRAYVEVGGKRQFFPRRELQTVTYSIEDTYNGLYTELRGYLGKPRPVRTVRPPTGELTYARYGLWHYVRPERQNREPYASLQRAGRTLCGLIRILLFKRFESSVHAFRETIRRLLRVHELFLDALGEGIVPAGEDAQSLLYECDTMEEGRLMDALREACGRYRVEDFDVERLRAHVAHDIAILGHILTLVDPITPAEDDKLQALKRHLAAPPLSQGKCLIFTEFADTARYLFENLNPGGRDPAIEVIFSGNKSKARVVGRFSPGSNPEYHFQPGEDEIDTLIATDVLSEGLNLQDCGVIINYDLHWNPVRLIQRFGRIDRIGAEHEVVLGVNFLPETGIERNLGLRGKLRSRIQEIHDTIGEDAVILDRTERLNTEAMYAIYEEKGGQLSLFEDEEAEDVQIDLGEAEEMLRQLQRDDPAEFERIAALRDGIRAARPSATKGTYVMCQAGRYQQLLVVDEQGRVVERDVSTILGMLRCTPDLPGTRLPASHNAAVMRARTAFAQEVRHRRAQVDHSLSLKPAQRYVLRELRVLFQETRDEDVKSRVVTLERAFRAPATTAVLRELNRLRRDHVAGEDLVRALAHIYYQYGLEAQAPRSTTQSDDSDTPRVICSEALL